MRTLTTIEWVRPPTDHGVDRPDVEAQQCVELTGTNRPRACHTPNKTSDTNVYNTRVHYTISEPTNTLESPHPQGRERQPKNVSVVIAQGKRPVPFRTRKLSLAAPMVLHPRGCGRVGHRRTHPNRVNKKARTTRFGPSLRLRVAAGSCGDQRLHEGRALGLVGFPVGGDQLLVDAPGGFDLDVFIPSAPLVRVDDPA